MKLEDLSLWRLFAYISIVLLLITLVVSIYYNNLRPILFVFILFNLAFITKCCIDYFDDCRVSRKSKLYRVKEEDDLIIHFHNTRYYLGTFPLHVSVNGVRIANIARGRNMDVPVPKGTNCITIDMRETLNTIDLTDISEDITVNTWVKYNDEGDRRLEVTFTNKEHRFNENRLAEIYAEVMRRRQSNARFGLINSTLTLVFLIAIFVSLFL